MDNQIIRIMGELRFHPYSTNYILRLRDFLVEEATKKFFAAEKKRERAKQAKGKEKERYLVQKDVGYFKTGTGTGQVDTPLWTGTGGNSRHLGEVMGDYIA